MHKLIYIENQDKKNYLPRRDFKRSKICLAKIKQFKSLMHVRNKTFQITIAGACGNLFTMMLENNIEFSPFGLNLKTCNDNSQGKVRN